jgi:hypothetical protein
MKESRWSFSNPFPADYFLRSLGATFRLLFLLDHPPDALL